MQRVIERMLNLLAFLLTVGRPVTADEIRNTVKGYDQPSDEAFRRTFERDKDLLRSLGVPINLKHTDVWEVELGYSIALDDYSVADPGFTDEERSALLLAAQAVTFGGQSTEAAAIFKLGGATSVSGASVAADLGNDLDLLGRLFEAVSERHRVTFYYKETLRKVEPYGLGHRFGRWYLLAPETGHAETVKAFRLDRMTDIEVDEESGLYQRPDGFLPQRALPDFGRNRSDDDAVVRVRFDREIADVARHQSTVINDVGEDSDGVTLDLAVSSQAGFVGWMLGFDDRAEILEPPEMIEAFLDFIGADA